MPVDLDQEVGDSKQSVLAPGRLRRKLAWNFHRGYNLRMPPVGIAGRLATNLAIRILKLDHPRQLYYLTSGA